MNYVIQIDDIEESVQAATRAIRTASSHGTVVKIFHAITPRNTDVFKKCEEEGINPEGFKEVYSRLENCIAAFLSHYTLWKKCVEENKRIGILEHDAVIINQWNGDIPFDKVCNIGKPSYGNFNHPAHLGVGPLVSKPYFGGAHAYLVNPGGAKELIKQAKLIARPTDVFLHRDTFPWLQEKNPYIAEVKDSFSTIQKEKGCQAKHNYGEGYALL